MHSGAVPEMGFAAGGLIKQVIQRDDYKPDTWDSSSTTTFNVQILNADIGKKVTGEAPPECPIDAKTYMDLGLPFFKIPEEPSTIHGAFNKVKSVAHFYHASASPKRRKPGKLICSIKPNKDGPKRPFRTLADIEEEVESANVVSFGNILNGDRRPLI